ncbi:unnamed protein product [Rhizophagus irregularis]|nr:unnamed protein product [Rhizophagus irregularis]CAB4404651.1 unnamed protein product [Rhizophagus irregularis]
MRKFAEKKGSLCLATEYVNRWDHHVKKVINERLQQRIFLRELGVEANNIAQKRGGECLSTKYVNTDTPMFWKCAKVMNGLQPFIE